MTMLVQRIPANNAAIDACGIWVLTWSIRSHPEHIALNTVVSDMGEHWSPKTLPSITAAKQMVIKSSGWASPWLLAIAHDIGIANGNATA